jgi:hypothetical protein
LGLFAIVKQIVDAGRQFRSLAEPCADTATSTGRLMITVPGGLAGDRQGEGGPVTTALRFMRSMASATFGATAKAMDPEIARNQNYDDPIDRCSGRVRARLLCGLVDSRTTSCEGTSTEEWMDLILIILILFLLFGGGFGYHRWGYGGGIGIGGILLIVLVVYLLVGRGRF